MVRSSRRFFPIFLVWRKGVVFRSNSYTNRLKSRWFFPKFRDWAHALQLGRADYLLSNLVNAALLDEVTLLCQSQVNLVSDFSLQCLRYSFASKCPNLVIKTLLAMALYHIFKSHIFIIMTWWHHQWLSQSYQGF